MCHCGTLIDVLAVSGIEGLVASRARTTLVAALEIGAITETRAATAIGELALINVRAICFATSLEARWTGCAIIATNIVGAVSSNITTSLSTLVNIEALGNVRIASEAIRTLFAVLSRQVEATIVAPTVAIAQGGSIVTPTFMTS